MIKAILEFAMNVFATLLFLGVAVYNINMPTEQDCEDMLLMMEADVAAALEKDPNAILNAEDKPMRLEDITFECRDQPSVEKG
jgi:hypothetical protein